MMTKNDLIVGVGVAALALGTSCGTASAQPSTRSSVASAQGSAAPSAAQSSDTNGDIVVTAQRREERLITVPASITAETQAALQRRGATQLEDVIRNTPGISNAGAGQGNNTVITIRGVSTGTGYGSLQQNTVALLLDDIPVDPATASIGTTNLRTVDIGRVEVLRGPQGTLFGSGSLSGAVRFITNKPDFSGFGASGEVTGATTRGGEGTFSGNLVVNAPIVDDKLAIRGVGYAYRDGGWIENLNTGQKNTNRVETYGGRVSVTYKPIDRLSFALTGIYQDSKDLGAGDSYYSPTPGVPDYRTTSPLARPRVAEIKNTIANLVTTYEFDTVNLTSSSTYQRRESTEDVDYGYFLPVIGAQVGIPTLSGAAPGPATSNFNIYSQELRLSSNGTGPFHWTVGGYYLKSKIFGNSGQVITADAVKPILGTNILAALATSGGQEELAGFGEATYTIANRLDFTAGVRVSRTKVDFTTQSGGLLLTGNPNPATTVQTNIEQKETAANPRFSIAYRPDNDTTFYVQAARGYRVGGPNLSAGLAGGAVPTSYKSDSLWNYEGGVKARFAGGRVRLSGAFFYIDWSDIQIALKQNSVNYTGNAGSARIYGLELEGAIRPTDFLELGGNFTQSSNKLTSNSPNIVRVTGQIGVTSGERLPASPETQANGYAELSFHPGGHDAYLRGTVQYIGDEYTDFGKQGTKFGEFATVDFRAGVNLGTFEVAAFVDNAFDSQGKRSASDATTFGPYVAIPRLAFRTRPRTVGLTLRARFGSEDR